jgi:hypothetical protein
MGIIGIHIDKQSLEPIRDLNTQGWRSQRCWESPLLPRLGTAQNPDANFD